MKQILPSRQTALEIICRYYPDDDRTWLLLEDRANNDPDDNVKEFAREKLGRLDTQ